VEHKANLLSCNSARVREQVNLEATTHATLRYCVKTAKHIVDILSAPGRHIRTQPRSETLIFMRALNTSGT